MSEFKEKFDEYLDKQAEIHAADFQVQRNVVQ